MATGHFFIGGGAEHSAEDVRRHTYATFRGAQGICETGDLKVRQLPVAGGGVRVTIGAAYINSRYPSAIRETYFGSVYEQETVTVPENSTGSVRRDLIVMRIKDPYVQGSPWADPAAGVEDPEAAADLRAHAQYTFVERVSSVPAATTRLQDVPGYENDTALTLARIDIPAMTSAITTSMIVDLRNMHQPRERIAVRAFGVGGTVHKLTASGAYPAGGSTWPNEALAESNFALEIPDWATQFSIISTVSGIKMMDVDVYGGDAVGWTWVQVGGSSHPDVVRTEPTRWDADKKAATHRTIFRTADTKTIPVSMRGTTQRFYPRGNITNESQAPGTVYSGPRAENPYIPFPKADSGTSVDLMVVFREIKE